MHTVTVTTQQNISFCFSTLSKEEMGFVVPRVNPHLETTASHMAVMVP